MMAKFDPARALTMASAKTVFGHSLKNGDPLVVTDSPSLRGEINQAMAQRLWASGLAVYTDDHRPTPVAPAAVDAAPSDAGVDALESSAPAEISVNADLVTWQSDDFELGRMAGDHVTNDDLRAIAKREGVPLRGDETKKQMQTWIMNTRMASSDHTQDG